MFSEGILSRGRSGLPPEKIALRAGPLAMVFEPDSGFLRCLRYGEEEVLRGIYVAVRDPFWDTVVPQLSNMKVDRQEDRFQLSFDADCRQGAIDFFWRGFLEGDADGSVLYRMEGKARSTFHRNRIGFCILHPASCAGRPYRAHHADGSEQEGVFPQEISPHQPLMNLRRIAHRWPGGGWADVEMTGDLFEMEDQRNWTDASFKTYGTPLDWPRPVEVPAGTTIEQSVRLRINADGGDAVPAALSAGERVACVRRGGVVRERLPKLGLGIASHAAPLSPRERERLALLALDHLRLDLRLQDPRYPSVLAAGAEQAAALGSALEIALFVPEHAEPPLATWIQHLAELRPSLAQLLVFHEDHCAVSDRLLETLRQQLAEAGLAAPLATGTNRYFAELNRQRPVAAAADAVSYTINPQVHAFDDDSLMETLEGQTATAESARRLYPDHALVVSPITLSPRFNPDGAVQEEDGALPWEVDPRQMSRFAAAWTLSSLRRLAAAGVDSLTYFETTGWRGVIETDSGRPSHPNFSSAPGILFPVYHVLRWLAELRGGSIDCCQCSRPLEIEAILGIEGARRRALVVNLTDEVKEVALFPGETAEPLRVCLLDASTAPAALQGTTWEEAAVLREGEVVRLGAYAVAQVQWG